MDPPEFLGLGKRRQHGIGALQSPLGFPLPLFTHRLVRVFGVGRAAVQRAVHLEEELIIFVITV